MLHVRISVTGAYLVDVYLEILNVDIPFLLGLDVLTQLNAYLDFDGNTTLSKYDGRSLPLTKQLGHVYIVFDALRIFTETVLRNIHRYFDIPRMEKLATVI